MKIKLTPAEAASLYATLFAGTAGATVAAAVIDPSPAYSIVGAIMAFFAGIYTGYALMLQEEKK